MKILRSPLLLYTLLIAAGFVLFCAMLKWQPWHERLHLPFLVLLTPAAAAIIGSRWNKCAVTALALLLTVNAVLVLWHNPSFPLARMSEEQFSTQEGRMFVWRPDLYEPTVALANAVVKSGATNVFLKIGVDTWEYPLWVCLEDRGFTGTIQHAFVDNETGASGGANVEQPGSVVLVQDAAAPALRGYSAATQFGAWKAYFK